jgi:ion channel-forming bestrophin family protein
MYIEKRYSFLTTLKWSKIPFIYAVVYSFIVTAFHSITNIDIALPYVPISLVGISVAFYLGFKNNSSYDRAWEARKIWGAIVNSSRSFAMTAISFIEGDGAAHQKKELIYRHIAWLTALRFQLRVKKDWENDDEEVRGLYYPEISEKYINDLGAELTQFISKEEFDYIDGKTNIAAQILNIQMKRLNDLKNEKYYDDFRHMELAKLVMALIDEQGKAERIKNFPFPRQYSSVAFWVTLIFCLLLPFSMLDVLMKEKPLAIWLNIPVSGFITWVFFLMEKIGTASENPFEGSYNDVPITTIARGIEIDIREMIDDSGIPSPMKPVQGFLH